MSVSGGRYCRIGDVTVLWSQAGRLLNSLSFMFLVISVWAQIIQLAGVS